MAMRSLAALLLLACPAMAQNTPQSTSRDLFYETVPEGDQPSALGVRLQVRKQQGRLWRVSPPEAVFHSGDRVRVEMETRRKGWLYVIGHGSDGKWSLLHPSALSREAAAVKQKQPVLFHAQFDEHPGEESVYILFTATPRTAAEDLLTLVQTMAKQNTVAVPDFAGADGEFAAYVVSSKDPLLTRVVLRHR